MNAKYKVRLCEKVPLFFGPRSYIVSFQEKDVAELQQSYRGEWLRLLVLSTGVIEHSPFGADSVVLISGGDQALGLSADACRRLDVVLQMKEPD